MGGTASKVANETKNEICENTTSAPILTPQIRRLELDPRSPSSDIARTPIEVLKTPVSTADNSLNITEDLSICDEDHTKYTNMDPRSPTTEFHRTPIIIEEIPKNKPIRNKNLDRVLMPTVMITPMKPKKVPERVIRKIYETDNDKKVNSPRLLESNPITIRVPENKRNSVVGLLETNIDFVETDLDTVIQNKFANKGEQSPEDEKLSLSGSTKSMASSTETFEVVTVTEKTKNVDIKDDDNTEDNEATSLNSSVHENEIEVDDESEGNLLNSLDSPPHEEKTEVTNTSEESNKISNSDIKTIINLEELDRKLTNLIYEDRRYEASPKTNKLVVANRTPLSDRNANSQQRKSIPVLKVSDKPKKQLSSSKIPVFKEKRGKGKINVQCENTPPRMQAKRSQWGAEDSLII